VIAFSVVEGSRRRETGPESRTPGLFRDKEGRERNTKMKRLAIPGLLLALIGIVLFAHQDLARVMQRRTELHASRVQRNDAALKAEQSFPLASLLAGFFFMSGIGLVAVTAHPVGVPAGSQRENPDTQVEETV
jgi:hypothetical protein